MIRKALMLISGLLVATGVTAGPRVAVSGYASAEAGFAVNSWLVPTQSGLVVIDTQFTVSAADKLANAVITTARPLRAIIITHPHPDHYNGTCRLLKIAHVPVYATQATIDGMRATVAAKHAQWKPIYGEEYPDETCFPDRVLPASGNVTVDGLELSVRNYGPGEASTESVVLVAQLRAAFVGDLAYAGVHPWLAEGRSALWMQQLDRLSHEVRTTWTVYPGHGPAGDSSIISAQREYLVSFRAATQNGMTAEGLSNDATQAVAEEFRTRYPNWLLETLIPINAGAVAMELAERGRK